MAVLITRSRHTSNTQATGSYNYYSMTDILVFLSPSIFVNASRISINLIFSGDICCQFSFSFPVTVHLQPLHLAPFSVPPRPRPPYRILPLQHSLVKFLSNCSSLLFPSLPTILSAPHRYEFSFHKNIISLAPLILHRCHIHIQY